MQVIWALLIENKNKKQLKNLKLPIHNCIKLMKSYQIFDDSLTLYQKIIHYQLLNHRAIMDAIVREVKGRISTPVSVLDLGCGDGTVTQEIISHIRVIDYTGVDLANSAIASARQKLEANISQTRWLCEDIAQFLRRDTQTYNLILGVLSLHHLLTEQKEICWQKIADRLQPNGIFLVVDLYRQENESRNAYLERYCQIMQQNWTRLNDNELQEVATHICQFDYPEPESNWYQFAKQAGLNSIHEFYRSVIHNQLGLAFCRRI